MDSSPALTLTVLADSFAIHRLSPSAEIPPQLLRQDFFSLTRTAQEMSLLVREDVPIVADQTEPGWRGLVIEGTLDFGMTGVLAAIAQVLAAAQVSIFAISTYDTDYIFVKADKLEAACIALRQAGYGLRDVPELA